MTATPSTWFLLADQPGWRRSVLLSDGTTVADGTLRLAPVAIRSVLDCPPEQVLELDCCERAVLQREDRRVALVTGTGQVRAYAGPWRVTEDGVAIAVADWVIPADGCDPVREWPAGTWEPTGLVPLANGGIGVLDGEIVHVVDALGRWHGAVPAAELPGCPWPEDAEAYLRSGTSTTEALDSGLPGCRWHRVVLHGTVPIGCRVQVEALATDADLTPAEVAVLPMDRWSAVGIFGDASAVSWDALLSTARGRYCWLRLTLVGDGTDTPVIEDVEVHLPRRTSMRYLPAVYAAGESEALERLLALTDTVRASVTTHLDLGYRQLDPRAADASSARDLLSWLGSLVGMIGLAGLPVERRRRLIAAAADLYRRRGTPDGVARHVALWLDRRTMVLEHYRLRRWAVLDQGRLGDATRLFGREIVARLQLDGESAIGSFQLVSVPSPRTDPVRVDAHRFTVLVHAEPGDDPDDLAARAERLLAIIRPAHTVGAVTVVTPSARVGQQASLGLDAVVAGSPSSARLATRLGAGAPDGRVLARDPRRGHLRSIEIDARVGTRVG